MHRFALDYLVDWKQRPTRKPLVIRGARQVGKSTLVRLFAKQQHFNLVEINLEKTPEIASLFVSNEPKQILSLLEIRLKQTITPGKALLFLDEIQATPAVFAVLRYFYEEMPELHIIAAGSLLEFTLEKPVFSVPVGRLEYLFLGPMKFEEFLIAQGADKLYDYLNGYQIGQSIPLAIHQQLLQFLKNFLIVGGMPAVVAAFGQKQQYQECERAKQTILTTYQDDFGKYTAKTNVERLRHLFRTIPRLICSQVKYTSIDPLGRSQNIAQALHLLGLARVIYSVKHASATGLPLGAEINEKIFKILFLDVGLVSTATGLSILDLQSDELTLINQGALCEQLIGQSLLYRDLFYEEPRLYYWARPQKGSEAEVDYLMTCGNKIVPIEVKAGKTGSLRSLHLFVSEKQSRLAIRFNSEPPVLSQTKMVASLHKNNYFQLLSLPLYLVDQVNRLARETLMMRTHFE